MHCPATDQRPPRGKCYFDSRHEIISKPSPTASCTPDTEAILCSLSLYLAQSCNWKWMMASAGEDLPVYISGSLDCSWKRECLDLYFSQFASSLSILFSANKGNSFVLISVNLSKDFFILVRTLSWTLLQFALLPQFAPGRLLYFKMLNFLFSVSLKTFSSFYVYVWA